MKSCFFSNHDLTPSHPKHLHTYHIPSLFVTSPKKMMRETTRNLRQSKHPIFPGEIPMMSFNPPFLIRENREIPPFFPGFSHPKPVKSHHFSWVFPCFFIFSWFFPGFPWFFHPKLVKSRWNPTWSPSPRGRCQSRRISVAPPRAWTPTDSGRLHYFMDGLIFDLFGDNYFYVCFYVFIFLFIATGPGLSS